MLLWRHNSVTLYGNHQVYVETCCQSKHHCISGENLLINTKHNEGQLSGSKDALCRADSQ